MARSYQDLLANAREQVPEVQVADLAARRAAGEAPLVIDVREQAEWDEGHIPGAVHIPRGNLESRIAGVATSGPGDRAELRRRATGRCSPAPRSSEMGYEQRVEPGGRLPALEAERPGLDVPADAHARAALALQPPHR